MIRCIALTVVLAVFGTITAAQNLTVRSGEHEGYTRLVVQVPPGTEWQLAHRKNGAQLSVSMDGAKFQTRGVFSRLSTNRLSAVSQTEPGAALDLEFGCDCVASAFLYENSMIVVDITQGTLPPPLLDTIPPPRSLITAQPEETPDLVAPLDLSLLHLNQTGLQTQLSTRLLQGADRDILDLNLAPLGLRASRAGTVFGPADLETNLSVTSVLAEIDGLLGPDIPDIVLPPACITNAELGFDTWSDGRPFPQQVADHRTGLFKEFDHVDSAQVMGLAKLYAYFGFGAEALRTLELTGTHSRDHAWVGAIARIVDERVPEGDSPFNNMQHCANDAAFWSLMTRQVLAESADLKAMEQAFSKLPEHMRRTLGPRFSLVLIEATELEAARRVMRSVDRVGPEHRPSFAKAEIADAGGDGATAEAMLEDVISDPETAAEAPLALARLVENRWVNRGTVSSREVDLAAAYALEFKRADIGPMMRRTLAVALALHQEFGAAFDLINTYPDGPEFAKTLNRHLQLLAERADDITFLGQVLALSKSRVGDLNIETAIALSDRLATLGFAAQSRLLANRPEDRTNRAKRARLRAHAALLDGRPHQAMLELSKDESSDADRLRVQALTSLGDFEAVADVFKRRGEAEAANRAYWLAGLSADIDTSTDGKYAQLGETDLKLSAPVARQPEKPLADAQALLRDSESARQLIAEMLEATERGEGFPETQGVQPGL